MTLECPFSLDGSCFSANKHSHSMLCIEWMIKTATFSSGHTADRLLFAILQSYLEGGGGQCISRKTIERLVIKTMFWLSEYYTICYHPWSEPHQLLSYYSYSSALFKLDGISVILFDSIWTQILTWLTFLYILQWLLHLVLTPHSLSEGTVLFRARAHGSVTCLFSAHLFKQMQD